MAKKVIVKLDRSGVRELLKCGELGDICMEYAKRMQANAGSHYAVEERKYPERTGAAVYPADDEGYYDNLHHNTLVKVLGHVKKG